MANDHEHKVVLNEDHKPKEDFIEAKIAIRALILGIIIGSTSIASFHVNFSELTIYFTILSFFHFLEFWITALYNPLNVSISSFLFSNGNQYILAHCFSILEYLLEYLFFPQMKMHKLINYTGLSGNLQFSKKYNDFKGFAIACGGQLCRSLSMIHATHNFSHKISLKKSDDHFLVTDDGFVIHPILDFFIGQ
ncbi:protein-S-isoprenylcysteine O-methyltransferase [Pneumocystis murina B123]|uniref:Protein-S-isoprenylcysteine O-methyltransferase n=1 Tax=Pneumocystis murina (strain B123) TaxID=1069680 RepID=M7NWZ1_PNEMU|nr:protein-S-isoprenylcysteine O-methyltransferase [Pneumocystis murina B123]EMR11797.1 protein-S-isoprenylcysteine O-methyltransferase [Pneumocystis murina B123]